MTLIAPGDPHEVRAALAASLRHPGPVYIRIGKKGEPAVHAAPPEFVIGKGIPLRSGSDAHLLSSGATLPIAVAAVERLAARGVSAGLTSMPTLKPLDEERLARVFNEAKVVATVEEHSTLGGLGGAVAEWASSQPALKARLARFGARDEFIHETCEQESARERFGLTPEAIADAIQKALA
jgi:transketolase